MGICRAAHGPGLSGARTKPVMSFRPSSLFANLALADLHQDLARNVVTSGEGQDLFDDLTSNPAEWSLALQIEGEVNRPRNRSRTSVIGSPFEEARWFSVIVWPFTNWRASRFSDGTYGVWYGSESVETTVYESAYHWYRALLTDAGFERTTVVAKRDVYWVACRAALLDFRSKTEKFPDLLSPSDYVFCQSVGNRIHQEGHPGLITHSVRRPAGENVAIFNPDVLSNPRRTDQLTYRLEGDRISVELHPGITWMTLEVSKWGP